MYSDVIFDLRRVDRATRLAPSSYLLLPGLLHVPFLPPAFRHSRYSASKSSARSAPIFLILLSISPSLSCLLSDSFFFLLRCKVSFNWVDIDRCNEKSCWGYSYELRPRRTACRGILLLRRSDKFFDSLLQFQRYFYRRRYRREAIMRVAR